MIATRFTMMSLAIAMTLASATAFGDPASAPSKPPPMFPKHSFTLDAAGAYAHGFGRLADAGSAELGVNYFLWDNFSIGAELDGYGITQPGTDATAIALELTLRHHLLQYEKFTLFGDAGFGPIESSDDVPDAGLRFNFVTRVGIGSTYRLDEHLHLMLGARYWHLSNARIDGIERNPSINGIEGYLGLIWSL